ncbi:uncharacterized protein [Argopecten irradians]|uniref:uncharacterized protein n=1 Tax=Argopecten irradians TaxID=31199 RepID=UPI003722FBD2
MLNIVILGHSFIRRLRDRVVDDPSCRNLKLSPENFNLLFRAQGGLTVNKLFKRADLLSFHHPDIVYLQIGGNDLCTSSPADVVNRILDLVEKLITKNKACHIIIGQLFWRNSVATDNYNEKVIRTNLLLAKGTESSSYITFWKHRAGFWKTDLSFLCRDGVHLNQQAQLKYLQSVKAAILTVSKRMDN